MNRNTLRDVEQAARKRIDNPGLKKARPYVIRAAIAGLLALAALIVAGQYQTRVLKNDQLDIARRATASERTIFFVAVALLLLGGVYAVRTAGTAIRKALEEEPEDGRGAAPAFIVSIVGYAMVILSTMGVLGVNLQGLLLGGAVTGVVLGIAAQQTLGNFFAGIVLLAVRPFNIGEDVILRSSPLGGEYRGRVTDMSLFYVKMVTSLGPVALPNAGVLAAAIGPGARVPKDDDEDEDQEISTDPDPGPAHGGTPQ
jgi:small-conductance mechanosensitive channel